MPNLALPGAALRAGFLPLLLKKGTPSSGHKSYEKHSFIAPFLGRLQLSGKNVSGHGSPHGRNIRLAKIERRARSLGQQVGVCARKHTAAAAIALRGTKEKLVEGRAMIRALYLGCRYGLGPVQEKHCAKANTMEERKEYREERLSRMPQQPGTGEMLGQPVYLLHSACHLFKRP